MADNDLLPDAPWATSKESELPDAPWAKPAAEPEVLPDVAKSLGTGLVRGAVGLAGLPGDVGHLINRGVDWAENKLGIATPQSAASDSFTTPALTKGLEKITGSALYEPKTTYGKYAQTIGEFVPGIVGGPEGLASRALTRVVAPAVASEAAGEATQGTALEPVARIGAALAAHGAGQAGRAALGTAERAAVPTIDELHDAANAGYRNARGYGVEIHRGSVSNLSDGILSDLANDGFRPLNVPKTWNAVEELKHPIGRHATIDDIDSVRKALGRSGANALEPAEREASRRAVAAIDNYMSSLTPADVAINPHYAGAVANELREARGNWSAMRGGQAILDKIEAANLRASSTYTGSNLDNAVRQNIRRFLDNPKLRRQLSPAEAAQAERIVRGTFTGNLSRFVGRNLRFILGSLIGMHTAGTPGILASHIAGHLLSEYGNRLTSREADVLARMARADSPLARTLPPESTLSGPAAYGTSAALAEQPTQETGRASGGAVTKGTKAGMTATQSRKASHYSPTRGVEEHHCGPVKEWHGGSCKFFKNPNACQLVGGHIAARGGCIWHQPLTKNRADGGSVTSESNFGSANEALGFNKQEADLYKRHLSNLLGSGGVDNPDGSRSSLYQAVQEHNGKFYNIPTVWNGKIETQPYTHPATGQQMEVPNQTALDNVTKEGWDKFPSYDTPEEADSRYDQMHGFMEKDTQDYLSQNRASGGRVAGFADGGDPDVADLSDIDLAQQAAEAAAARVRAPYAAANARPSGLPPILEHYGNAITSALTAPQEALEGKLQVSDPETGMPTPEAMQRAQGVVGLATLGAMPMAETGALGMLGGKPFYSAAQEAAANSKAKVMQPQQWLGYLKNQPGVKPAELEHVDLENWLKNQSGPVSRETLNDYISSKQPEIQEVRKGGDEAAIAERSAKLDAMRPDIDRVLKENDQLGFDTLSQARSAIRTDGAYSWEWNTPEDRALAQQYHYEFQRAKPEPTRYGPEAHPTLSLPGGSNYGETLLTLPENVRYGAQKDAEKLNKELIAKHGSLNNFFTSATPEELRRFDEVHAKALAMPEPTNYRSSHWDEPNVLLHIRHNDREIANHGGNGGPLNSLHIEELQSDAMQQGRKSGYKLPEAEYAAKQKEYLDQLDSINHELRTNPPKDRQVELYKNQSDITDKFNALHDSQRKGVTNWFPFKTTWADLGLKRMLHRAATERNADGTYKYDALSWTPGEAQADRYDLSKHINQIHYSNTNLKAFNHAGEKVMDQTGVAPEELPKFIGNEAAEKLLSKPKTKGMPIGWDYTNNRQLRGDAHVLEGQDLKVGGEGMRGFYDKMLPDKANSIVKKYGAKAEKGHIEVNKTNTKPKYGQNPNYTAKEPVHVIKMTPQLRAAAEKGLPLFKDGGAVAVARAAGGKVSGIKIDRSYDIPWMSILNNKGTIIYIDRSLKRQIPNNGKLLDISKPLIEHERAEYAEMRNLVDEFKNQHGGKEPNAQQRQKIYLSAHKNHGEVAERKWIESNGFSWSQWNAWTRGELARIEKKKALKPPPSSDVNLLCPHGQQQLGTTLRASGGRIGNFADGGDPTTAAEEIEPIASSITAPPPDPQREAMRPFIPRHDPIIPEGDTRPSLTEYHPSIRDRLARALLGENPSLAREQFVHGTLGSRGLGNTGMSLAGLTPAGIPMAMEEAARAHDPAALAMAVAPPAVSGPARALKGALSHELPAVTARATEEGLPRPGELLGGQRQLEAPRVAAAEAEQAAEEPLEGLPSKVKVPGHGRIDAGPFPTARRVAREYMEEAGLTYDPVRTYAKVDEPRAKRIAQAFEDMPHDFNNPEARASYEAMANETMAQWQHIKKSGLQVEFIPPGMPDPYEASPRLATEDIRNNNHMWVFPTDSGYGETGITKAEEAQNPMLRRTGEDISGKDARVNDIFRIVHDYFGHAKEGVGFRGPQPLSAKILIPTGWTTMGDIKVGDYVINPSGGSSRVANVYPHGEHKVYKVTFNDGSSTKADSDHRWKVRWAKDENWLTRRTCEIAGYLTTCTRPLSIPITEPVEFEPDGELPIDPYIMGVLLGDGHFGNSLSFFSCDDEIVDRVKAYVPESITVKQQNGRRSFNLTTYKGSTRNEFSLAVTSMGLRGARCHNKFIPERFKISNVENRINILRGLMDTDGNISKHPNSKFTYAKFRSVSKRLAEDVQFLVRSLGGTARIIMADATEYTYKGERRPLRAIYTVGINMPSSINPFYLSRKANAWNRKNDPARAIVSIEECGVEEVKCINLDSENHLYITDDFIVTMNSGEENAWRSHAAMYSPLARKAMTTETRGQNSWLNYGPHGEANRNAKTPDTVFADQKFGLLPDWVMEEGRRDPGTDVTHPAWIDQRLPTSKKDVATGEPLKADLESMKASPKLYEHNVGLTKDYPNTPESNYKLSTDDQAESFINHAKNNILWLHEQIPPNIRERSKLWYEGGRKIIDRWSKEFGLKDSAISGVMAALSPQMDWFQNVSLARRVLEINTRLKDLAMTPEMVKTVRSIPSLNSAANRPIFDLIKGKSLNDIDKMSNIPVEERAVLKAMWTRLYDESHNSKDYRIVTPEGEFGDYATTKGGIQREKMKWNSLPAIAKAIRSVEENGSQPKMNMLMGMKHKIRNFYNNLLVPNSTRGDVTVDTHAVAAGLLRPLAGEDLEVSHNFRSYAGKDMPQSKGSAISGIQGTYPLYAEAYRRAAAERNILPREMQSITWEGVRGLFPEDMKNAKFSALIDGIWNDYRTGKASLDETRSNILEAAGGIRQPKWASTSTSRPTAEPNAQGRGANNPSQLPESGLSGETTPLARPRSGSAQRPKVAGTRSYYPKAESRDERDYLARSHIESAFREAGMPMPAEDSPILKRMVDIVGRGGAGVDPFDAYERAIMEAHNAEPVAALPKSAQKKPKKAPPSAADEDVPFASGGAVAARASGGRVLPHYIDHNPSEAQKRSGNYKKFHTRVHGLEIAIENTKGSKRSGIGKDGKPWSVVMPSHYGDIKKTTGSDLDNVDVYLGPHHASKKAFIIDQKDAETGNHDEFKTFLCFGSINQVKSTFLKAFSDGKGKQRLGNITEMPIDDFKNWLKSGNASKVSKSQTLNAQHKHIVA